MSVLERVLRWIVLSCVFTLPFVPIIIADGQHFPYNLFFPFITGKNFAFRILVEIMAGAYLALALVFPQYRPRRSWILGALSFFVVIIAIADIFGAYPFKSIWSNYERMDGLVTLVHVLVYTVIAAGFMTEEKLWRRLFWTSLAVSGYLAFYAFLQVAGVSALGGGGTGSLTARVDATFGNPIYLAVYMLFHIFMAALLWAQQWVEKRPGERLPISLLYGGVMIVDTLALLFTSTRGTMLGLIGGTFVTIVLLLVQANSSRVAWRTSVGALVGLVLIIGGVFALRDTQVVHHVGFLQRLSSISLTEATVKARFLNWSMAWEGVKERPLLGWGQENYALVFDKYYDPRMYAQEPWFDRVHNVVFDWLVAGGFLGLLAYLSIFAATLWVLWRKSGFSPADRSILTGLLLGYFCHNFFVFDNVSSYILFATILAFIAYRSTRGERPIFSTFAPAKRALSYTVLAGALFTALIVPWVNANAFAANQLLLTALMPQPGGIMQNLALFQSAIARDMYGTQEAREQLAQAAVQVANASGISQADKIAFGQVAATEMEKQAARSPLDARFPLFLSMIFDAYGAHADAATALEKAHELSPRKQTIIIAQAQNAEVRGDASGALSFYKHAYELEPAFDTARYLYAGALVRAGKTAEAVQLMQEKLARSPGELQAYVTLAAIYYKAGNTAQAIATLEEAKVHVADAAAQVDPLILQIRSGTAQL